MRRVLRALKATVLAATLIAASLSAQQVAPQAPNGAAIHGFLFDALTATRMNGTVVLQDLSRRTVKQVNTRNGEYQITGIPDGNYFLRASDYGAHVPQDYGQLTPDSPPMELRLVSGASHELSFMLERAGTISGRLTDPEGGTVTSAELQLLVARYDSSGNRFLTAPANVAPARVNRGGYTFSAVPPGEYYVRASIALPSEQGFNSRTPVNHNVRTYYPGVKEPELAVPIEMPKSSKSIANINFFFRDISQFKVAGKIAFPAQMNTKDPLYIYLVPRDNFLARLVDTPVPLLDFDEAREPFELRNVQPGSYDLYIASITNYAPAADGTPDSPGFSARVPVVVRDSDVTDLLAELEPGVNLHGEFKLDSATDVLRVNLNRSQPVFVPQDGKPWPLVPGASVNPNTFVQSNGSFDLIHAAAGQYRIGAVIPEDLYLSEAWLGPRNITGQAFEIERRTDGPLQLVLRSDGAKFEGTITDADNNPANVLVVLVPPQEFRNDPGVSKAAHTDKSGHFLISGIRPGMYTAYAFPKIESNAWLNDDFMNPYRALGLQINFGKGTLVYRDFKSIPMPK
jgi:hypothetical protein